MSCTHQKLTIIFAASNLARSSSNANKNAVNKNNIKTNNSESLNNGNLSNVINNNGNKNSFNGHSAKNKKNTSLSSNNRTKQGSMDEISPWLVQDNVISKKSDKSKIPMLKTVITTEL